MKVISGLELIGKVQAPDFHYISDGIAISTSLKSFYIADGNGFVFSGDKKVDTCLLLSSSFLQYSLSSSSHQAAIEKLGTAIKLNTSLAALQLPKDNSYSTADLKSALGFDRAHISSLNGLHLAGGEFVVRPNKPNNLIILITLITRITLITLIRQTV